MRGILLALGLILVMAPATGFAGKLDDFESAATKKKHEGERHRGHSRGNGEHHHRDTHGGCHGFFECLISVLIDIGYSGSPDARYEEEQPRESHAGYPGVAVDIAYQNVEPGLYGIDASLNADLRYLDLNTRFTTYVESSPTDTLQVSQLNLVFPARLGESLTIGGGLGIYQLAGNNTNTMGSISLPVLFRTPGSHWNFALTPVWVNLSGNTISDVDYRISYHAGRFAYSAGYRTINAGSQFLAGVYLGAGLNL